MTKDAQTTGEKHWFNVVHRPTRKKMVAIYDRVFDLAIAGRFSEIERLVKIVSVRSCRQVRLSAWMATSRMRNKINRSPLADCELEYQQNDPSTGEPE